MLSHSRLTNPWQQLTHGLFSHSTLVSVSWGLVVVRVGDESSADTEDRKWFYLQVCYCSEVINIAGLMYCTRKPIKLHCILIIIIVICISYTAFEPSNDLKALYILLTPPPPPPTHTHMYTPIPAHLKGVYKRDTCYNAPRVIKVQ